MLNNPILKKGSSGPNVTNLQDILTKLGYALGTVDGIFGSMTENAVRSFQADAGIAVDGIAGPQTWGAIHKAIENAVTAPQGTAFPPVSQPQQTALPKKTNNTLIYLGIAVATAAALFLIYKYI